MKQFLLFSLIFMIAISSLFALNENLPMDKKTETFDPEFAKDFYETEPPVSPARSIAEFEPMTGVLVRYPFGISTSLIQEMAEDAIVYTIVNSQSQQNSVISQYTSAGVNLEHCEFIIAPSDSYWTRDFGPWYVMDGNDEIGIVNFPYNRPRPNDNDIPIEVADALDIELYGMNVVHTGGNYMTDGLGIAASTPIVYTESQQSGISNAQVDQRMLDYLGIQDYHVVDDPNNTYIDHIDCWGKFLAPDKILIRSVPTSHPQYDEIEETASYFAAQTSSYGTPFKVYRVYTPQNQPYTNALILNHKVFVPITGSSWDDDAIATYEEAMPGYEIYGFTGSWESTDALHCRTKGMADLGMLYVQHYPILGNAPTDTEYEVSITIKPLSGASIIEENTKLFYSVNGNPYESVSLYDAGNSIYHATIPEQQEGDEIHYYIQAEDSSGRISKHPIMGEHDPHIFYVGAPIPPELVIEPEEFNITMNESGQTAETLSLSNIGGGIVHYNLSIENTTEERNLTGSTVECDVTEFTPGEEMTLMFSVSCVSNDNEWIEEVEIDFPTGVTVNSASGLVGGNGGTIPYAGSYGDGISAFWGGDGYMANGNVATTDVDISISPTFADDIILPWTIQGDIYGSPPHTIEGEITITSIGEPITWISFDNDEGELPAGSTDEIQVVFDTSEIDYGTYTCNIIITDDVRNEYIIPVILFYDGTTNDNDVMPVSITLNAYPNPFNPITNIAFSLSESEFVNLSIYNLKGEKVKTLVNEMVHAGEKIVIWNGTNNRQETVSSGIYFYRLETKTSSVTKKIMLLK